MRSVADVYLKNMVEGASPLSQVIMLYDKAIECLERAIELQDSRDKKEYVLLIDRVYDIVSALRAFLNREKGGEIAKNLYTIYTVILSVLVRHDKTREELLKVLEILKELRSAWAEIQG
ncbi:MAG: flagellar export chaperone FliS [Aquificae bacterium]|nr:flagellar export chaperone FliS [Aquificota bacterium]